MVLSHVYAISFFPLLQFLFLANSLTFFCRFFGARGTKNTVCVTHTFLSVLHTCIQQKAGPWMGVPGMTDVLLGMLAQRKCLEKGGGSPKCNTEALSCFCRTTATIVHVSAARCFSWRTLSQSESTFWKNIYWLNCSRRLLTFILFCIQVTTKCSSPPSSVDFQ